MRTWIVGEYVLASILIAGIFLAPVSAAYAAEEAGTSTPATAVETTPPDPALESTPEPSTTTPAAIPEADGAVTATSTPQTSGDDTASATASSTIAEEEEAPVSPDVALDQVPVKQTQKPVVFQRTEIGPVPPPAPSAFSKRPHLAPHPPRPPRIEAIPRPIMGVKKADIATSTVNMPVPPVATSSEATSTDPIVSDGPDGSTPPAATTTDATTTPPTDDTGTSTPAVLDPSAVVPETSDIDTAATSTPEA